MPGRRNFIQVSTARGVVLVAVGFLVSATLFIWVSGNRVETPTPAREPRAHIDHGEIRPQHVQRTVSEQQAKMAAEVLRGFPLDQRPLAEPVTVLALVGDPEAAEYARQLTDVLKEGGW